MPTREEYNSCMRPYIAGKGKTKEQRQLDFCAGAKLCTGKATNMEQALKICRETPPKEPKVPGAPKTPGKRRGCSTKAEEVYNCVAAKVNPQNLAVSLREAIHTCSCNKMPRGKPDTTAQDVNNLLAEAKKYGL